MMVKFKNIVLASLLLTSVGVSSSQTRIFDLGNSNQRVVAPVQALTFDEDVNTTSDVRLQGVRQEDGTVIFHKLEEDDLLFTKEEDGTVVDQWGNVVEQANEEPEFELDPFYRAVTSQNTQQLQLMLAAGQDPNKVFDDGNTALHLAAYYKNRDMVQLLLWYNASLSARNTEKSTPLHLMCAYGSKDMLEQAKSSLKAGYVKALNTLGAYKRNCLHYAMMYSTDELVINELLNSGMEVSKVSDEGHTPAHTAVMMGHWNKIKLLAESNSQILLTKGEKNFAEKSVEDLMYERMDILNQLSYLKYFSEEKQELLNDRFNKANL